MVLIVNHGINWEKNEFFWHKIPAVDSAIHKAAPQYFIIFTVIKLEYHLKWFLVLEM